MSLSKDDIDQAVRRLKKDAEICRAIKSRAENYDPDALLRVAEYLENVEAPRDKET